MERCYETKKLVKETQRLVKETRKYFKKLKRHKQGSTKLIEAEIQDRIDKLESYCAYLYKMLSCGASFRIRPFSKLIVDQLDYENLYFQVALQMHQYEVHKRKVEESEREALLNRRSTNNSLAQDSTIDHSFEHNKSLQKMPTDPHQRVFLTKYERRYFWPKWLINLSLDLFESESGEETDSSSKLPVEIFEKIFKDFGPCTLAKCSLVSSHWRKSANSNKLWSRIYKSEGWTNVKSLTDMESNFRNTMMQFHISTQPKKIWPTFELMEAEFQQEDELRKKSVMKEGLKPLNNVGNVKEKVVEVLYGRNNFLQGSNNQSKPSETSNKKEIQTREEKEDAEKEYDDEEGVILENGEATKFGIGNDKLNKEYGDSSDDKLVPISEWKLCYLQRKFLEYHWQRGTYVVHWFGDGFKQPDTLTFFLSDPYESFLYFPVNELRNGCYELNLCKLDGTPRKVATLECSMNKVKTVCFSNELIAYVYVDQLKFARPSKVKYTFERFGPFNIIPDEPTDSLKIKLQKNKVRRYFIKMNCKYVISGDELIFIQVWCKNTLEKVCLIECPDAGSIFAYIILQSDYIFFATEGRGYQNKTTIYKYSIVNKTLSKITCFYGKVLKLLANDIYLIIIQIIDTCKNEIIVYKHGMEFTDLGSKTRFYQDVSENRGVKEPQVLLFKDLLFYQVRCYVKVTKLNERFQDLILQSEFNVKNIIHSMHNVLNNLLIIRTRNETEIWDWKRGERLYTPNVDAESANLFYDCTRLIYVYNRKGEIKLYGFW